MSIGIPSLSSWPTRITKSLWPDFDKKARKLLDGYTFRICYEAGPTGYHLQRRLTEAGYDCIVVAPNNVPQKNGDRVKNDPRDAINLARCLRSGDLDAVYVPAPETEGLRDPERCRQTARNHEIEARNQLSIFLQKNALEVRCH